MVFHQRWQSWSAACCAKTTRPEWTVLARWEQSSKRFKKSLKVRQSNSANDTARDTAPTVRPSKIRVLIVDDHAVVRQGLRMFIDLQDDMVVVGEGTNGTEAIELAGKLNPDIVLLDLVMPQMDGVAATSQDQGDLPVSARHYPDQFRRG